MPRGSPQRYISVACEEDLERHGDSFRGAGYTKSSQEAHERYAVMLGVIREPDARVSVLDFGCGIAHMLDHIRSTPARDRIEYTGLDLSEKYLAAARRRHPAARLLHLDVLESDAELPEYDYVVLNGLFNWRGELDELEMVDYFQRLLPIVFRHCRRGLAFNVMSTIVDWKRDDLFHLSFDTMARFVAASLSRHFVVRHDYAAYEYTTYVYRAASPS